MRSIQTLVRGLAGLTAALMLASGMAALIGNASDPPAKALAPQPASAPTPLFGKPQPAANPSLLALLPDDTGVTGWVAGTQSFAGKTIEVTAPGYRSTVSVRNDNTFHWERKAIKPSAVKFTLALPDGKKVSAQVTLEAATAPNQQSAFFITDRSAYRPKDTVKFVAFLRAMTSSGEFQPISDRQVAVTLTSRGKQTRAGKVELKSDAFGRIVGELPFSEADALDHYALEAAGFVGKTEVLLAEYRKTQVSLAIAGEVKGDRLALAFSARDYLGRPVRAKEVTYTAVVKRVVARGKTTLNSAAFAHPQLATPPSAEDLDVLPNDERLTARYEGISTSIFTGFGTRRISERNGKVGIQADGSGKADLAIAPDWQKDRHTLEVTGVLIDELGRENTSTKTFELSVPSSRNAAISTPRTLVALGEKVPITVAYTGLENEKHATTLVVLKLETSIAFPTAESQNEQDRIELDGEQEDIGVRLPAIRSTAQGSSLAVPGGWRVDPNSTTVKKSLVLAKQVVDGKAEVDLKEPGAYELVAITELGDGKTLRTQTGVVVKPAQLLPVIVLELASSEIASTSPLRGVVQTRFANAKLLLSLRDSSGVRFTKVLTASPSGVAAFAEALPANVRYGCALCVQYLESETKVHADQRELLVIPADRTIAVTATVPESVKPGAEVALNIAIDREEAVDLVVTVYDEALKRVTDNLAPDVRDFYLADARGQTTAAVEFARTRFGKIPIASLIAKAKRLIATHEKLNTEPGLTSRLQTLVANWKAGQLRSQDCALLVRLAGYEVYFTGPLMLGSTDTRSVLDSSQLADMFEGTPLGAPAQPGCEMRATFVNGVVVITVWQSNREHQFSPWASFRDPRGGFGGNFNCAPFGFGKGGFNPAVANFQGSGFNGGFGGGFGGGGFNGGFGGGAFQGGGGFNGLPAVPPVARGALTGVEPALMADDLIRRDFADTAFWSATVRTDARGKATVPFKVPDSLTKWQVAVTAISGKMHVGSGTARFNSTKPVMIWPILPRAAVAGDIVRLSATVHNLTTTEQKMVATLSVKNGKVLDDAEKAITVPANATIPVYWSYRAASIGTSELTMSVAGAAGTDAASKSIPISMPGVEEVATVSGIVGNSKLTLQLPPGFTPENARLTVTLAPSVLADMADTLPYLVDYPYGCVEQTMSRFLPAIRVAQILKQTKVEIPADLESRLPKVINAAIKRLIELQHADGGWGWHGTSESSGMMTAYALLGLIEAEKAGYALPNSVVVPRGMEWLKAALANTQGVWDQPAKNGGRGSAGTLNDSLYCLAIFARKEQLPAEWWKRIEGGVGNPLISDYGHALMLQLAAGAGKNDIAAKIADVLRKRATIEGEYASWQTAGFSRWQDNTIEITAATLQAFIAFNPNDPLIPKTMAFLTSQKRGNRWDSTKDTAAVLFAFCDLLRAVKSSPNAHGEVAVSVEGRPSMAVKLDGPMSQTISLPVAGLKPGANTIAVRGDARATGAMVRVAVRFARGDEMIPAANSGLKVERTLSIRGKDGKWTDLASGATVPRGSYIRVRVRVEVNGGGDFPYTLVESPKPACGETVPREDVRFAKDLQIATYVLREDRDSASCFHYETASNWAVAEYIFLIEFAGEFRLPPARAERMYQPTNRGHSDSFALKVAEGEANP